HAGTGTTLPTSGTAALYYHRNQQYSIVGLSDAAGTLVERYAYTAYGELTILAPNRTARATSSFQNRYTYTGREWDPTLRLYYLRARWLEPKAGRFIGRDPLGYVDGPNLYEYVHNNPSRGIDPSGLFDVSAWVLNNLGRDWAYSPTPSGIPIGLGGGRLLVVFTFSGNLLRCCNAKNKKIEVWYNAVLSGEAYFTWGYSGRDTKWEGKGRDRNKLGPRGVKNKYDSIPPEPIGGYRERNWHLDAAPGNSVSACPEAGIAGSIYIFIRGTIGAYYGAQFNIQQEVYPTFDANGFSLQATAARGVYGASVEVGAGGSVSFRGPMPGMN
ncbi:MAG: RHS repeat-associated core domain-containing protein, partial [Planctomycetota bacterium]